MYLLIIFLPLLGSLTSLFFGRYISFIGAASITSGCIFLTFIFSCIAFYEVALLGSPCYFTLGRWIYSEYVDVDWGFQFDSLTVVMLVVVTFVSCLVHIYSSEYMRHDPHVIRFMSYLSLFTFFMIILVTADNFIQMFLGWEGVGLCSFLLINFWFGRIQANKAAIKAMLINRVGDFCLILGIIAIFCMFKSFNYCVIFATIPYLIYHYFLEVYFLNFEISFMTIVCLLIFLGAVGKSAQLFLHTWLPDAMEGPTPVSALIHAATMVTAGVFLIVRCSPFFEYSGNVLILITIMGAMTAFFGSTVGLLQNDLKRVIAYSTCSQLGYMVFTCGLSNYPTAIFHLSNHAFFKALLFLSAGSIIHAMGDEQDMRRMGGLKNLLPFSYAMVFIGSLALMGFPFLTGFYSKDVILELAFAKYTISSRFAYWLGTISAFFTAFYSIRLLFLVFLAEPNAHKQIMLNAHDAPFRMALPLFLLSLGSIFIGYLSKDMFIGLGTNFWGNSIFIHRDNLITVDSEFLPTSIKLIPVCFSIFGAVLAFILYAFFPRFLFEIKLNPYGIKLYNFFNRKWYFDKVYNDCISSNILSLGYHLSYKAIDRGSVERLGSLGVTNTAHNMSLTITSLQSGYIYHYAFTIFLSIVLIMPALIHGCLYMEVFVGIPTLCSIFFILWISDLYLSSKK